MFAIEPLRALAPGHFQALRAIKLRLAAPTAPGRVGHVETDCGTLPSSLDVMLKGIAVRVDGLWTAIFVGGDNVTGSGVVVFDRGRVLGGDNAYFYMGSYSIDGPQLIASVLVQHFHGELSSIFGSVRSFNLSMSGAVSENLIVGQGVDVVRPYRKLTIRMQRIADN